MVGNGGSVKRWHSQAWAWALFMFLSGLCSYSSTSLKIIGPNEIFLLGLGSCKPVTDLCSPEPKELIES